MYAGNPALFHQVIFHRFSPFLGQLLIVCGASPVIGMAVDSNRSLVTFQTFPQFVQLGTGFGANLALIRVKQDQLKDKRILSGKID